MRISEMDFANQAVVLDFQDFVHCTFRDCQMIVHGVGDFSLVECKFEGQCALHFAGPAATTLKVLAGLYHGGFQAPVEAAFENIRQRAG